MSNNGFYAPAGTGISLYSDPATPVIGDITSQIQSWDAGTEMNQMPGADYMHDGAEANEYPGAQTQANTVEGGNVRLLNDTLPWPKAHQVIKVTISKN